MSVTGPIVIVDDDLDDQLLINKAIEELDVPNKCIFFDKCSHAIEYLKTTTDKPLIIISDINLPEQSGIDFKRQLDSDPYLKMKSIPFVFLSTSADKVAVTKAYSELTIQGFFQKALSFRDLQSMLKQIIEYWRSCKHPNSFS
jgi:CheY-like chemotaxis protein